MDPGDNQKHKSHNRAHSGRKADKKHKKDLTKDEVKERKRNPKAFAIQSAVKAERRFRHKADKLEKKYHIPTVDRTPVEPPPIVVSVVGPRQVGKSTLICNLVKHFSGHTVNEIKGPITVVAGKHRRFTFLECNNDINNMIDLAKISDISLLLIDASFGFEMETFEYLNICKAHGEHRIMGVLTHLDQFNKFSKMKKAKKDLRKRFWTEVYAGAKLFYLSRIAAGNEYVRLEIRNLARFLSVMKLQPVPFRQNHPYMLCDRLEDMTDPEQIRLNDNCNRNVVLYGYSRGSYFKPNQQIHLMGCGDLQIDNISFLPDPCPLPEKKKDKVGEESKKRRLLNQKEKLVYAPFSGLGGILYDKDAVYIDLGTSHHYRGQLNPVFEEMNREKVTIDQKMSKSQVQLFSERQSDDELDDNQENDDDFNDGNDEQLSEGDFDEEDDEDDSENENASDTDVQKSSKIGFPSLNSDEEAGDEEEDGYSFEGESDNDEEQYSPSVTKRQKVDVSDEIDDDFDEDKDRTGFGSRWKQDLSLKAAQSYYRFQQTTQDLQKLVYGEAFELKDENETESSNVQHRQPSSEYKFTLNLESTQFVLQKKQDWNDEAVQNSIRDCFVTGRWSKNENAEMILRENEDDLEEFGDFDQNDADDEDLDDDDDEMGDFEVLDDDGNDAPSMLNDEEKAEQRKRLEKKRQLKEQFDMTYDDMESTPAEKEDEGTNDAEETRFYREIKEKLARQSQLNKSEFEGMNDHLRVQFEGYRPGMYIRIQLKQLPCEFVRSFDPTYPIIIGGLLSGEASMGFVQVRIKKHRWYPKILKTRNPLIISLGWRRFQTMPIYSMQDHNGRDRCLKYTPQHLHCYASFYGPITPQGTGFVAIQECNNLTRKFRIAATGNVLNLDRSLNLVKKLKVVGQPMRIYRKTAFIKGMFNSVLEVSKFEGALIKTVSGIRGHIKKAISKPEGAFRATFEDKILLSDLVFLRSWYQVQVPEFYYPVSNLLLDVERKERWFGMKTVGQLRHEQGLHAPQQQDSFYKIMERKKFTFKPFKIPYTLEKELPFRNKPKYLPKKQHKLARPAVVREPEEQKVAKLQKRIRAMYKDNTRLEREQVARKHRKSARENAKKIQKKMEGLKRKKKAICKKLSMNGQLK